MKRPLRFPGTIDRAAFGFLGHRTDVAHSSGDDRLWVLEVALTSTLVRVMHNQELAKLVNELANKYSGLCVLIIPSDRISWSHVTLSSHITFADCAPAW